MVNGLGLFYIMAHRIMVLVGAMDRKLWFLLKTPFLIQMKKSLLIQARTVLFHLLG